MIARHPVAAFFVLALALSWAGWIPSALASAGLIPRVVPAELIWLAEYGPSLAAVLVTARLRGRSGVRELLARALRWRVAPGWYLVVLGLTPALAALVVLVAFGLDRSVPPLAAFGAWQTRFVDRTAAFTPNLGLIDGLVSLMRTGPIATAALFILLGITNGGISEEIGWRGFAQPWLQRRWNALVSAVMVGALWALWHTGTAFWQVILTTPAAEAFRFAAGYLGQYLVLVVPLAVIYGWVVNSTGSVLLAILLHASYNVTIVVVTAGWREFPLAWLVGALWVVALGLVARAGPARLARAPTAPE